ncbi:MAG: outer membrane protein assembly factor BamE [Sideroxydans sp.]
MRIAVLIVLLPLAACSNLSNYLPTFTPYKIEIRQGNLITQEMRARLKTGMTQLQVKAVLGAPLIADPFHADRWDYLYRLERQGRVVQQQRLTLYFENGLLARIDEATPLATAAMSEGADDGKN